MASILKDVELSPIELASVAEVVNSRDARSTTLITVTYKQATCGKTCKHQRKLTSIVWEKFSFFEPNEEGNLWCKRKKCGLVYSGNSKYGKNNTF